MSLWKHQTEALEYLNTRTNGLLRHGVGTGKTRTTLEFIQQKKFPRVLIIGTGKGITVWENEVKKHGYNFLVHTFSEGSVKEKAFEFMTTIHAGSVVVPHLFVMSYDAFKRKALADVLLKVKFDAIIFDEIHRLRNHTTKQSKVAWALAKSHPSAYRVGLTGTLLYNKPIDAFGIFRFLDPQVFGTNWNNFKFRYAIWKGQFAQIPVAFINTEELGEKIRSNSHLVDRNQVLDLPLEQHNERYVEFDSKAQKTYDELNKEFVTVLEDKTKLTAKNILDKILKLQQLTGGFIYKSGETITLSHDKADLLKDLLEEIGEQNAVVFYRFAEEANIIGAVAKSLDLTPYYINGQSNQYEGWLSNTAPSLLVVQIQSGSESLDFTKASITIYYSLPYSYGQYEQSLGRISRANQLSKRVAYYYLLVKDSIDERILRVLRDKKDLITELLESKKS